MRFIAVWVLLAISVIATAQSVRESPVNYGTNRRASERSADARGFASWPHLADGDNGTTVQVSFDYKNADVTLLMSPPPTLEKAMDMGRKIASAIGYPNADYIYRENSIYTALDIELNKYIVREGKVHRFELDLGRLRQAIEAVPEVPKPIAVHIEGDEADQATLVTGGTRQSITDDDGQFRRLDELKPGDRVTWSAELTMLGIAGAVVLGLILGGMFVLMVGIFARSPARPQPKPAGLSPEQVQAAYDSQKPLPLRSKISAFLPLIFITFTFLPKTWTSSFSIQVGRVEVPFAHYLPQASPMVYGATLPIVPVLIGLTIRWVRSRRLQPETPAQKAARKAEREEMGLQTRSVRFILISAVSGIVLMVLIGSLVRSGVVPKGYSVYWGVGSQLLGFVIGGCITALTLKKLPKDDPVHGRVLRIAEQAGVKVRRVELVKSASPNAFATHFGTIGLTTALLEHLEPAEVDAVVAHEIGHLKRGHVKKMTLVSVAFAACFFGGLYALQTWGPAPIRPFADAVDRSPIGFMLPLILLPLIATKSKRNEFEADAFAVRMVGDPEVVISALTKITDLNQTPRRLKPKDEKWRSHPSLENRIAAIRAAAGWG